MIACSRGDVVLVSFTFSDQSGAKLRPALVMSSDAYHASRQEVILAAVTSNVRRRLVGDHVLNDWKAAGLLFPPIRHTVMGRSAPPGLGHPLRVPRVWAPRATACCQSSSGRWRGGSVGPLPKCDPTTRHPVPRAPGSMPPSDPRQARLPHGREMSSPLTPAIDTLLSLSDASHSTTPLPHRRGM